MGPTAYRGELVANQLRLARKLLAAAQAGNPFYRRKLEGVDCVDATENLERFRAAIPFTTKAELTEDHQRHPPFGSNLTYPIERYSRLCQTSGSSGEPMRWLDTPADWAWMLDGWRRVYQAAGVRLGDRLFFGFSFGPFLGFWTAYESACREGLLCVPGGGMSSVARLRAVSNVEATVLLCTPTYAIHLGNVAQQEGLESATRGIRRLIVAGEPGGSLPEVRAEIEARWPNAQVVDHHGMTEVGPVSYACPERPGVLRVMESHYLAEILDPETQGPTPPGGRGELTLTTLGRMGSPLIRYRTGDLVRATSPEDWADRDLGLDGGILGRLDGMLLIRGVNIFPSAVEAWIRRFPEIEEFRVTVDRRQALPELEIDIEPKPEAAAEGSRVATDLQSALQTHLQLRTPVNPVEVGALPRFEMKARRWVQRG